VPLRLKRCLQPREQVVERLAELGELVVATGEAQARLRLLAEMSRAVAVMVRSGRRNRRRSASERERDKYRAGENKGGTDVELPPSQRILRAAATGHAHGRAAHEQARDGEQAAPSATKAPP